MYLNDAKTKMAKHAEDYMLPYPLDLSYWTWQAPQRGQPATGVRMRYDTHHAQETAGPCQRTTQARADRGELLSAPPHTQTPHPNQEGASLENSCNAQST